jgi:hypothetical protein
MEPRPGELRLSDVDAKKFMAQMGETERTLQARHDALSAREKKIEKRLLDDRKALESKEQQMYEQMEQRSKMLEQRETALAKKQYEKEEKLQKIIYETEMNRRSLTDELRVKTEHLSSLIAEVEQQKARFSAQSQEAIQKKSGKFVSSALATLETKEGKFHGISITWAVLGALSLLLGVVFAIASMIYSSDSYHQAASSGLGYYLFHLFRGLIVVGVFAAISRYAFIFSNSYMHESLKAGERVHAIKFGEFYLDTFGATAEWEQVKEAFIHWNISGQSAFSRSEGGVVDVSFSGAAGKIAEKAIDVVAKKTSND